MSKQLVKSTHGFYEFHQNNSFGVMKGPAFVIIEAHDPDHANYLAERHGLYFDGAQYGGQTVHVVEIAGTG